MFVPSAKYSHNINSWCEKALTLQAVYQMQVDLGARLVICMCSCGMLVSILVIIAKPTSSGLLPVLHIFNVRILQAGHWAGLHVVDDIL